LLRNILERHFLFFKYFAKPSRTVSDFLKSDLLVYKEGGLGFTKISKIQRKCNYFQNNSDEKDKLIEAYMIFPGGLNPNPPNTQSFAILNCK
jgi:hypothetical protein